MRIVLFEGCDYSGKTTVAKALANMDSNGVYYHSPSGTTNTTSALYDIIKSDAPDITTNVKLLLMLTANVVCIEAMNVLKQGYKKNVYADRTILSMLVYQAVPILSYIEMTRLFTIPVLDVDRVFLFTADTSTLIHRFKMREHKNSLDDFFMKKIDCICARYEELITHFYPPERVTVVDTSNRTVEDTIRYCAGVIG